jgi:glucose/arabinose dehydrogenase
VKTLLTTLAALALAGAAHAADFQPVAAGFDNPVYVTSAPNDPATLYVVERAGDIRIVRGGAVTGTLLDIRSSVWSDPEGEGGLLSVAFSPGFAQNHLYYVDYTDLDRNTHVVEYRAGDPSYSRELLFVPQTYPNHKGGQLQFDAQGRLYVGMGDGGAAANSPHNDPDDQGQNLASDLGKLLRIDPLRSTTWQTVAYGLRNPWRFSFDRSGNLWLGDVGAGSYEEVDFLPRAQLAKLTNFGWSHYEGRIVYNGNYPLRGKGKLVFPVWTYTHDRGSCAIVGGYVYRGRYWFGDLCSGIVWSLESGKVRSETKVPSLVSFGEDSAGNLYAVSLLGTVYEYR